MRSDLQITRMPTHSEEWYAFRKNGIGGSEVGDLLLPDKDHYDSAIWIFHQKIGSIPIRRDDNEYMFWGRAHEDNIADKWRFWDGSPTGYIDNFKNNRIIRDCRNVNGYIVNPDYPWLFASVDRLINIKGGRNLITGNPLTTEGILECKNLNYWAAQKWEDRIPPYYLLQVSQYMIILETDYAEIAILMDGNKFRVEPIQRDDELCNRIISITKNFWYNRVLPAQKAFENKIEAEKRGAIGEIEKWDAEIQKYEPEVDKTESYKDFLSDRFLKERETIDGTMSQYDLCKQDKVLLGIKNLIETERQGISNTLLRDLTLKGAEAIDFGKLGTYSWSERKGHKNRVALNNIKEKPTDDVLMKEFKKLNLECY